MSNENDAQLLVAQMKRVIELIEKDPTLPLTIPAGNWVESNPVISELKAKLHEIRRDSIRLSNNLKGG